MGVQTDPGKEHQRGVGELIKLMEADGVTVTRAVYGRETPPDPINSKKPDAFGHFTDNQKREAIGEAEHLDRLFSEDSMAQRAAFQAHAMLSTPEGKLYLVVIGKPESLEEIDKIAQNFFDWKVKFV